METLVIFYIVEAKENARIWLVCICKVRSRNFVRLESAAIFVRGVFMMVVAHTKRFSMHLVFVSKYNELYGTNRTSAWWHCADLLNGQADIQEVESATSKWEIWNLSQAPEIGDSRIAWDRTPISPGGHKRHWSRSVKSVHTCT